MQHDRPLRVETADCSAAAARDAEVGVLPYLTISEAAELARISPKRLRNLMVDGPLKEGIHYTRPSHLGPRFKRAALLAWLDPHHPDAEDEIPLVASKRRVAARARETVQDP